MARERVRGLWSVGIVLALVGCDEGTTGVPVPGGVETAVVLNSVDLSLTVFPVDTPENRRTIGLAQDGSPVTLAARNHLVVVPLGIFPAVAVVDLAKGDVGSVALPQGSGGTGVAFVNDSIAYVGNPDRNSVSVVNVVRRTLGTEIAVGMYPQWILAAVGRVFVLNAELDPLFQPARTGRVSVIDPASHTVLATVDLSGFNPAAVALGPDGLLYVVNSGSFGAGNGSLSVVSPSAAIELEHHPGFGEFPGRLTLDGAGRLYVSSFSYGIAIWDAATDQFVRSPAEALVIDGYPASSSGVAFDSRGRLYTLVPNCAEPGTALRLNPDLSLDVAVPVGICPIGIVFTQVTP